MTLWLSDRFPSSFSIYTVKNLECLQGIKFNFLVHQEQLKYTMKLISSCSPIQQKSEF